MSVEATDYEPGYIEAIHFRADVGTEDEALAIAHDYRGALYVAGVSVITSFIITLDQGHLFSQLTKAGPQEAKFVGLSNPTSSFHNGALPASIY